MTTKEKTELAKCFVSNPENDPGAHDADRHLCTFKDVGVLTFKFSARGGSVPGLGFYVADERRSWFEQELSKVRLPKGFFLNTAQVHMPHATNGWVAFGKEGIKTQAQAYADIVKPGVGIKAWRQCFGVLCKELETLTGKTPKFHGLIQQ